MPKGHLLPNKYLALVFVFSSLLFHNLLFYNLAPAYAQDAEHFYTKLTSRYTVDHSGNTKVEHTFNIHNLTPEYYISSYEIKLGTDAINNITAVSRQNNLTPEISQSTGLTEINISFPDKVVGKDKVRQFTVSYSNPIMSEVNGQVLETFIPSMDSEELYDEHKVILITPVIFGHPSRINPKDYTIQQEGDNFVLTYQNLGAKGVSAIFGSEQIFNFKIRYHLENPGSQPAITQVSLPPDTPFQKIFYHNLEPKPEKIAVDVDGNWIATYYLPANNVVQVDIDASVLVSLDQIQPHLNQEPLSVHLESQSFWQSNDQKIIELARQHSNPESIYQFVVNELNYTEADLTEKLERLGAVGALQTPNLATCQEFSDLFIAVARAANIPAKRATGYAHSNDPVLQPLGLVTDILHAWPEYYDEASQSWVPIDPTWGSTMKNIDYFNHFDLKHIVFAYNGKSSRFPLAAGDYKLPNQESKDIKVEFGTNFPEAEPKFEIALKPRKILSVIDLPSWYDVVIENSTGQAWYNNQLTLSAEDEGVILNYPQQTITLLPWQTKSIPIQVFNKNNILPKTDSLEIALSNHNYEQQQVKELKTIRPISDKLPQLETGQKIKEVQNNISQEEIFISLGIIISLTAITTGSLLVFKRRQ